MERRSVSYETILLPGSLFITIYITLPPTYLLDSNPTAIMPMTCINCKAVASPDHRLQYCAGCQSALYCSRACQKEDWKKQHQQICKLLNVGHGDTQVRTGGHKRLSITSKELFELGQRILDEDIRFKLEESTFERSQAAARKMKKIAKRQDQAQPAVSAVSQLTPFSFSLTINKKQLRWPNSPLFVLLCSARVVVVCRSQQTCRMETEEAGEGLHRSIPLGRSGGFQRLLYPRKSAHPSKAAY